MFLSDSMFGDLVSLSITFLVLFILYCKWSFGYWKRKNVPYLEPQIPYGNIADSLKGKENIGITLKRTYLSAKEKGWKHAGLYFLLSPQYLVLDLDLVKSVLTKDFQHFVDRTSYFNERDDPLSAHLVNLTGDRWRRLRAKLTPTFTSGKMKTMFQTLVECEVSLRKKMEAETREAIDIKDVLGRFTTDIIGSCAFGLDCKSFEEDDSPFRIYGKKIFEGSLYGRLKRTFATTFPQLGVLLGVTLHSKDVSDFYMKVVKDTVDYRELNGYTRNDFMQLMIDMKNRVEDDGKKNRQGMSMNELAAQSFVFFAAGFETSSTLMTFALYELSKHRGVQEKLREEIDAVLAKHGGKITYDSLQEMKYLSQVIDETLRLHPPVPFTVRKCTKDYKVPNTDVVINKGTTVIIPIMGIHHDEEYYPDPEKFDPDRFSEENKSQRPSYTHLPFGEGPRICIGLRFGLMEAKVGLVSLIKNFKFTVNSKTVEPLKMEAHSLIFSAEGGIWLNAEKI